MLRLIFRTWWCFLCTNRMVCGQRGRLSPWEHTVILCIPPREPLEVFSLSLLFCDFSSCSGGVCPLHYFCFFSVDGTSGLYRLVRRGWLPSTDWMGWSPVGECLLMRFDSLFSPPCSFLRPFGVDECRVVILVCGSVFSCHFTVVITSPPSGMRVIPWGEFVTSATASLSHPIFSFESRGVCEFVCMFACVFVCACSSIPNLLIVSRLIFSVCLCFFLFSVASMVYGDVLTWFGK